MVHCSECGSEISDEDKFCPDCGSPVGSQSSASRPDTEEESTGDGSGGATAKIPGMKPGSTIRNGILGVVYLFLILAVISAAAGTDTESGSSGGGSGDSAEQRTHEIGSTFAVGSGAKSIEYTVTDVNTAEAVGSQGVNEEADGTYVVVTLELENVGDESIDLTSNNLKVVDEDDNEFEADTGANIYIEQDSRFDAEGITFEQLQPGLSTTRTVVFDVPPGEYTFRADPAGAFSGADAQFVPLGEVSSS